MCPDLFPSAPGPYTPVAPAYHPVFQIVFSCFFSQKKQPHFDLYNVIVIMKQPKQVTSAGMLGGVRKLRLRRQGHVQTYSK